MDRFRLYSILKVLNKSDNIIDKSYLNAALDCALKKGKILLSGAEKRRNESSEIILRNFINQLEAGFYKQIDYPSLLEI